MSMFNQEKLVERTLGGIIDSTTTPFNLILVFDGCTDRTEEIALAYIKKRSPALLRDLRTTQAPNVFELKANNIGYRLSSEEYLIYVQDDIVIEEKGWERRLTYPLRAFDDIFAVGSRLALNTVVSPELPRPVYFDVVGREYFSLPRSRFAIRSTINYAPVAFRMDIVRKLDYLDEVFHPGPFCEVDLVVRAFKEYGLKSGALWIGYRSDVAWGKTRSKDSTADAYAAQVRNMPKFFAKHPDFAYRTAGFVENRIVKDRDIDWRGRDPLARRALLRLSTGYRNALWLAARKRHALKVRIGSIFSARK